MKCHKGRGLPLVTSVSYLGFDRYKFDCNLYNLLFLRMTCNFITILSIPYLVLAVFNITTSVKVNMVQNVTVVEKLNSLVQNMTFNCYATEAGETLKNLWPLILYTCMHKNNTSLNLTSHILSLKQFHFILKAKK